DPFRDPWSRNQLRVWLTFDREMDVAPEVQPAAWQDEHSILLALQNQFVQWIDRKVCGRQALARSDYSKFRIRRPDPLQSRGLQAMSMALLSRSRRSLAYQLVNRFSPPGREEAGIARTPRCRPGPGIPLRLRL